MDFENILYEVDEGILTITLNRPEIMNAFKQHGVVESEGEDDHRQYDRGFDVLNQIKKKSKDSIRVNNRLFGDP